MEKYIKQFENCLQGEKPFCTNICPFHVDILDFQAKMSRNNYNSAYKTFRNAVAFPDIVSALCPEYCAAACPRGKMDKSVQINLLEKTCVAKATKKDPTDYNLPIKNKKVAIIGAGISGLACALRLSSKKYEVTIFEKTDRIGGQLWDLLPSEVFLEDIRRQFQFENYTLNLNAEIKSIEEISNQGFDAVYVATGKNGHDFGALNQEKGHCVIKNNIAIFAGGSLAGKDPMYALADGLNMSWSLEVYFKTGKLEYPEKWEPCKIVEDPDKLKKTEPVIPTDNGIFTDEEVVKEANRCIRCQCDFCKKYFDLSAFTNKWPLKMRDEIFATVTASESMLHKSPAKKLINSCTQSTLFDDVCPGGIKLSEMIQEARYMLHKQGKMPGAYHQFWLNDMNFSNSKFAALRKNAPGQEESEYAFFPGCNLGAADPRYVSEPYKWLLSKNPKTGILLRCCSIPVQWAGDKELHKNELDNLVKEWEILGKPTLIMACPYCQKHLTEFLPEIKTISLYEILDKWGSDWDSVKLDQVYSVFDPCSARDVKPVQTAVRNLAENVGVSLEEFPKGDKHGCCGFGGHGSIANPEFAEYVAKQRSELNENPYIAYCINCRDVFLGEEKPVLHILDLLFDINMENNSGLPTVTERRVNRVDLKETLLKEIWGEKMTDKPEECKFDLIIGPEIKEKMNELKILEEDICEVLEFAEKSKRRTYKPEKGTYTCYREIGYITYWLEYRIKGEAYEIVNVYTHRMKIELEGIWNGRKTDADLR
ncbi:pyridine nucleotide-disulfide oxidoreductase/dicluster-binding protein [Anaerovorax odorimutans]|uniref:pyridine nucleotide-disulfide oxidoreductase/dicluster-binding protein n=1 Tax=Anaerovorax odorimutans TaxID=109327 RepID=UPI00042A90D0|nr:pyridine nucleotide-disulfide oxidoreductase/dicluster-binding protein [Anaerovorax odorimutans]